MFRGELVGIYTAPAAGAPMVGHERVVAVAGVGLAGDRYAARAGRFDHDQDEGRRALTLVEREAIEAARREADLELDESELRRNLVTAGVPLNHLVGRELLVGSVRLRGVRLAEPCAYLEGLLGREGVRRALVHRGGLRCEILAGGDLRVGDPVVPA